MTQTSKRSLDIHPFALFLPEACSDDFSALVDDIKRFGVRVPVVLFEGKILDGRSRYKAARQLKIAVPTENFEGSLVDALRLVQSYNLYRRHLQPSQKAGVAAKIAMRLQQEEPMSRKDARHMAAAVTGASESYTQIAQRIMETDPEKIDDLVNGKTNVYRIEFDRKYPNGITMTESKVNHCPRCGHNW